MTVVETIVEQLQDRILAGQFPPGSRLPSERELSAQMQVARAPVREALSRLEQMRLISVRHGQGSTVTDYTSEAGPEILVRLLQQDHYLVRDTQTRRLHFKFQVVLRWWRWHRDIEIIS